MLKYLSLVFDDWCGSAGVGPPVTQESVGSIPALGKYKYFFWVFWVCFMHSNLDGESSIIHCLSGTNLMKTKAKSYIF